MNAANNRPSDTLRALALAGFACLALATPWAASHAAGPPTAQQPSDLLRFASGTVGMTDEASAPGKRDLRDRAAGASAIAASWLDRAANHSARDEGAGSAPTPPQTHAWLGAVRVWVNTWDSAPMQPWANTMTDEASGGHLGDDASDEPSRVASPPTLPPGSTPSLLLSSLVSSSGFGVYYAARPRPIPPNAGTNRAYLHVLRLAAEYERERSGAPAQPALP